MNVFNDIGHPSKEKWKTFGYNTLPEKCIEDIIVIDFRVPLYSLYDFRNDISDYKLFFKKLILKTNYKEIVKKNKINRTKLFRNTS